MLKYLIFLLSFCLLILSGCGGEPQEQTDTEDTAEIVETVEIPVITALADPGSLIDYRGLDGEVFYFHVTGDDMGSVWGDRIYTDDSYLATAAVHAGVLEPGESGIVMVTILPGEESYPGIEQNGVISWDYGEWSGSYSVEALTGDYELAAMPDPGNLVDYRDMTGESFTFQVTGDAMGSVWGSGIYTDDSNLAAAAVHAGVLEDGETGVVVVTILPGEEMYTGSEQNGVTSWDYGEWSGSYIVE